MPRCAQACVFRRVCERSSLRAAASACAVDDTAPLELCDAELTKQDQHLHEQVLKGVPHGQAQCEARKQFAVGLLRICVEAMEERDLRVAQFIQASGVDSLRSLQLIGQLLPATLLPQQQPLRASLVQVAGALDHTREARAHELAERLGRLVSVRRGRAVQGSPPRELAMPNVTNCLLQDGDVVRLLEGQALIIDPEPTWLEEYDMRVAERELRAHLRTAGLASSSSCNTNAITADLPLLGDGFGLSESTQRLLRMLAAVPAAIEAQGWPRSLRLPPLLQLAIYSGRNGAKYSPHFDSNPWETHNHRELTVLLYLNVGWDAAASGGSLRVLPRKHPPHATSAHARDAPVSCMLRPVEVAPVAGRLVIFHSRLLQHEVLPCTAADAERLALTLWVESDFSWDAHDAARPPL